MGNNSSHMSGLSNNPAGAHYSCQHLQRTNQFGEVRGQIHMALTLGFGLEEDINRFSVRTPLKKHPENSSMGFGEFHNNKRLNNWHHIYSHERYLDQIQKWRMH